MTTTKAAGVTHLIARNEIASKLVASYIFEPDVADLNIDLLSTARKDGDHDIQEFEVLPKNPFIGKKGKEAFHEMKDTYDAILMGITKMADGVPALKTNPNNNIHQRYYTKYR